MKQTSVILGALMLAGCGSLSGMAGDPVEVFPVAPDAPERWAAAGVTGEAPMGDWLSQFGDPVMESLVAETLQSNPNIRAQHFAVQAARAQARGVYGRSLPNVGAGVSGGVNSTYSEAADERFTDPTYSLGLDASWTADLWGRVRASIEAAQSDFIASEADLASARLSLAAQTAIAWTDLNEAVAQQRVAVETYEARERILSLTERRFARGLVDSLDVRLARSALASAEAAIAAREQASDNAVRRLEILVGRYPANAIDAPGDLPELQPIQAAGTPVMLLTRRPDVAAAEARVVSAGLRAEQARLAVLPSLSLTASVGTSETDFSDLFDPTRIAANAIASIAQPVFNGGALKADKDAALANAEAVLSSYVANVLLAWREVEDAIGSDRYLAQQVDAQSRALEEALRAEELATRQYSNGLITIFNLIDAQTRRLNAESTLISARAARVSNRIAFHLAIGGGIPGEPVSSDQAGLTP